LNGNTISKYIINNFIDFYRGLSREELFDNNLFKDSLSGSGINFVIMINKKNISDEIMNKIKMTMVELIYGYLSHLKKNIAETNFFGEDFDQKIINFCNKNNISSIFDKNMYGDIIISDILSEITTTKIKTKYDTYISDQSKNYNITYIKESTKDILKLQNNFLLNKSGVNEMQISGDILNVVIQFVDDNVYTSCVNNSVRINYSNNILDAEFDIFGLDKIIDELEKNMFGVLFPWLSEKFEKNLQHYLLLLMIRELKQNRKTKYNFDATTFILKTSFTRDSVFYNFQTHINKITAILSENGDEEKFKKLLQDNNCKNNETYEIYKNKYDESMEYITKLVEQSKSIFSIFSESMSDQILKKTKSMFDKNQKNQKKMTQWGGYFTSYKNNKKLYQKLKNL
jgi:hypothetical protein